MGDLEEQIKDRVKQMEAKQKTIMFFGTDLAKIPCFKQSFFTGILSGVGTGIGVFMFTSRPLLASHSMLGAFGAVTIAYYGVCRYQYAKETIMIENMKGLMREAIVSEGIEQDKKVEQITKLLDA